MITKVKCGFEDEVDTSSAEELDGWSGLADCDNSNLRTRIVDNRENMITSKQKKFLEDLAYLDITDNDERERFLATIGSMSREDASEMLSSMIRARGQR